LEAELDNEVRLASTYFGNFVLTTANAKPKISQDANKDMKNNTKLLELAAAKFQEISATKNMIKADGSS
jgi:hypothetical protein